MRGRAQCPGYNSVVFEVMLGQLNFIFSVRRVAGGHKAMMAEPGCCKSVGWWRWLTLATKILVLGESRERVYYTNHSNRDDQCTDVFSYP